jgi:hypothetical protein
MNYKWKGEMMKRASLYLMTFGISLVTLTILMKPRGGASDILIGTAAFATGVILNLIARIKGIE